MAYNWPLGGHVIPLATHDIMLKSLGEHLIPEPLYLETYDLTPDLLYRRHQIARIVRAMPYPRAKVAKPAPVKRTDADRVGMLRSRVTNGRSPFVVTDQRSAWARRWRDIQNEIISDLGGADHLSEGQRQLVRRATTIAIACEQMEGDVASGKPIDLDAYGTLTDRIGRAFARLGLKRQAKDITPKLSEYLRAAE
jgi:hypothetical protein